MLRQTGAAAEAGQSGGAEGGRRRPGSAGACPEAIAITGRGESGAAPFAQAPPRRRVSSCSHLPHRPRLQGQSPTLSPPVHPVSRLNPTSVYSPSHDPGLFIRCARTAPSSSTNIYLPRPPQSLLHYFLFYELLVRQHGGRGSCACEYISNSVPARRQLNCSNQGYRQRFRHVQGWL